MFCLLISAKRTASCRLLAGWCSLLRPPLYIEFPDRSDHLRVLYWIRRIQLTHQRGADPFSRFQTTHKLWRLDFTRHKQCALERHRLELSDYYVEQTVKFAFPIGGPIEQRTEADPKLLPETQARHAHRVVERSACKVSP